MTIGYIPGAPALQAVGREIEKLKRRAKAQGEDVLYLLDRESRLVRRTTLDQLHLCSVLGIRGIRLSLLLFAYNWISAVMGDIGKGLYVAEDVVPIYRQLLSLASIITPNQFETEWVQFFSYIKHSDLNALTDNTMISTISAPRVLYDDHLSTANPDSLQQDYYRRPK
jgi:hypothetical protein